MFKTLMKLTVILMVSVFLTACSATADQQTKTDLETMQATLNETNSKVSALEALTTSLETEIAGLNHLTLAKRTADGKTVFTLTPFSLQIVYPFDIPEGFGYYYQPKQQVVSFEYINDQYIVEILRLAVVTNDAIEADMQKVVAVSTDKSLVLINLKDIGESPIHAVDQGTTMSRELWETVRDVQTKVNDAVTQNLWEITVLN